MNPVENYLKEINMIKSTGGAVDEKGERLIEYFSRVILHSAIISDPEKVAWFLASYAMGI